MAKLSKWQRCAEALRCVLPKPLCTRRCELLPQVLEEWERSALGEHLSREPRADIRRRIKKLDTVTKLARHLHESLDKLEQADRYAIVLQMIRAERSTEEVSWKEVGLSNSAPGVAERIPCQGWWRSAHRNLEAGARTATVTLRPISSYRMPLRFLSG